MNEDNAVWTLLLEAISRCNSFKKEDRKTGNNGACPLISSFNRQEEIKDLTTILYLTALRRMVENRGH